MDLDNDDLDEDDLLRRDMAREVEEAFATVPYPGDDKLLAYPNHYESKYVWEWFRGKHWKEISTKALRMNEINLWLFTPEAFRFYLPCYMIGGLLHVAETNLVWDSVFSNLTPPESDGPAMDEFVKRVNLLDARQKAVVRRYVELYVQTEISFPDPRYPEAVAFWRRITEPKSA